MKCKKCGADMKQVYTDGFLRYSYRVGERIPGTPDGYEYTMIGEPYCPDCLMRAQLEEEEKRKAFWEEGCR